MADYYSLLTRVVGALPDPSQEARRAIYERARKALLNQLRHLDPPAAEADVARESAALDAAIARIESERAPPPPPEPVAPPPAPEELPAEEAQPAPRLRVKAGPAKQPPRRSPPSLRVIAASVALAFVVAGMALAAYVLPNPPFDAARPKPAVAAKPADPKAAKINERITGADASTPAPQPAAPVEAAGKPAAAVAPPTAPAPAISVEQRAALLLQQPGEGQNVKVFVGTVVWRLDNVSRAPGQPSQMAVRADIDIPEAKLKASLVFQNNQDPSFSASHTMQLRLTLGADNPAGGFKAIRVPEMREEGSPTGSPLVGLPTAIKENFFLVALQQGDAAEARNQDLIKSRAWIDVPLQTTNDRLSKLAIEKGPGGDRVLNEAFASWKK